MSSAVISGSPDGRTSTDAALARNSARISKFLFDKGRRASLSLGKRKEHPEKYGAEELVPQEESLARKKQRTLWDGSLSQTSATDLAPLGTLPRQLNDHPPTVIEYDTATRAPSSPETTKYDNPTGAPPPQYTNSLYVPNGVSEYNFPDHDSPEGIPVPEKCGRTIHPAYADDYRRVSCPMWLTETLMDSLKDTRDIVLRHGDLSSWRQALRRQNKLTTEADVLANGGKKQMKRTADGRDISYRHRKWQQLNLVRYLEELSQLESAWEEKQPTNSHIIHVDHVRLRKQWGATSALHWYKDMAEDGFIGRLEKIAQTFSRKRGRDWEGVADEDYPDYFPNIKYVKEYRRFFDLTDNQADFVINPNIPQPEDTDIPDLSPRRKCRRQDAGVRFNPEVYVRADADVDVLRKEYTSLSEDFLEDKPVAKKPEPRIHRTTTFNIDPTPSRAHDVIPLNTKDGRRRGHYKRHNPAYRHGQWAIGQGMESIDTSGRRRDWDSHFVKGVRMQQEAAAMDNDERYMKLRAPMAEAEIEDAPTPQQEVEPMEAVPVSSLKGKLVRAGAGLFGLFGAVTFMGVLVEHRYSFVSAGF